MGLSESERRAVKSLADRLARQESVTKNLSRAQQIAHSTVTVPDGTGTVEMLVPEAVGRGVQAGFDAKAVDEKLDTAKAELEQAQAELDDKLADAELGLEGANQRLNDAEDAIGDAFVGIDEAITLADQAKSNMPNRVDDPDFSFGDKNWQGSGGQFYLDDTLQAFFIGARFDGTNVSLVSETVSRVGTTGNGGSWGTGGSTYELRFEGTMLTGSAPLTVTFGYLDRESMRTTATITDATELAEPIRLTMTQPYAVPLSVKIESTTTGGNICYITGVSVTDVTTITEVKQTADAALVSANGKQNIYYDSGDPSGTAPDGSVWYKVDGTGTVLQQWQYVDGAWVERPVSSEAIANLDVGKLTAGGAVIAELVAQAIASATASFQRADIKNLFVTAGATINEAVINKLWADVVVAKMLVADKIISSEAIVDELVGKVITAVTINGGTINGTDVVGGRFTTAESIGDHSTSSVTLDSANGLVARNSLGNQIVKIDDGALAASETITDPNNTNNTFDAFTRIGGATVRLEAYDSTGVGRGSQLTSEKWWLDWDSGSGSFPFSIQHHGAPGVTIESRVGDLNMTTPGVFVLETGGVDITAGTAPEFSGDKFPITAHGHSLNVTTYDTPNNTRAALDLGGASGVFTVDVDGDVTVSGASAEVSVPGRIDLNAANGVYVNGTQVDADTGWIDLAYASGFTAGTAGQLSYRVKNGVVYIRGGAAGDIAKGTYQVVTTDAIPTEYRPSQHYRTGGMGTGMNGNTGIEVNATDGKIRLGWGGDTKPSWFAAGCSYPVE